MLSDARTRYRCGLCTALLPSRCRLSLGRRSGAGWPCGDELLPEPPWLPAQQRVHDQLRCACWQITASRGIVSNPDAACIILLSRARRVRIRTGLGAPEWPEWGG